MSKIWDGIYCLDFFTEYNPFFLKDMSKALERTVKAINKREKIVIYGACNVDSICGVSLLMLVLKYLNADVEYYIPDTVEENYVMNSEIIHNHINFLGASLILTVGCSFESSVQIQDCKNLGIDVVILDICDYINEFENIIVNPKQKGCLYKFKDLSSSGLAFKLIQAISMYYDMKYVNKYLDLVMLGILAADVPLIEENSILVNEGLKYIPSSNNYGIKALLKINGLEELDIESAKKLIFIITPTINAIGKMDNARIVVELFNTKDGYRAEQIVKYLSMEVKNNISCNLAVK
jgi:Single-stranded DNA-specific exonuclease